MDRCGAAAFSSGRGLSRARRGTDIHGEWSFSANGDRSSRSASGPLVSPPPFLCRVVCGSQGCGCPARALTRAHFSLWFAASLWTCWGRLPPRRSLLRGPLPPCRGKVVDPLRCIPFPNGVCTRPALCEPCGAPGAFRALTTKVPASELAVALPAPRRASCAPWCLCLYAFPRPSCRLSAR